MPPRGAPVWCPLRNAVYLVPSAQVPLRGVALLCSEASVHACAPEGGRRGQLQDHIVPPQGVPSVRCLRSLCVSVFRRSCGKLAVLGALLARIANSKHYVLFPVVFRFASSVPTARCCSVRALLVCLELECALHTPSHSSSQKFEWKVRCSFSCKCVRASSLTAWRCVHTTRHAFAFVVL